MTKQENHFVAVEANIGAGKSTLLPRLVDALNELSSVWENEWVQLQEPVDDPEFDRLLCDFYANPTCTETRLRFQMYITNRRSNLVEGLPRDNNYVIERSLFSDLIFSQANFLSMECPEGKYMEYYYDIKRRLELYPYVGHCVYLRTDPNVALSRVVARSRGAEEGMPLSYMEDIHLFHEACLPQICRTYGSKLLTYDWNCFGSEYTIAPVILESLT